MSEFNVAVVDCSLPVDHKKHVKIRRATAEERAAAEAGAREVADAPPAPPTLEERIAALEAKS